MKTTLILATLFLFSCTHNQKRLNSNLNSVKTTGTGAIISVDLDTQGKIKRGKKCNLIIGQNNQLFSVPLKEGSFNYALPLGEGSANLKELNCGPFYYYKLVDRGAWFDIKKGTISYLGTLDFSLEDKGEMTWGPSTKSKRLLEGNLGEMGLTSEEVVIDPLKI